jgi:isopentenyl-diphosphate delta-isomerase
MMPDLATPTFEHVVLVDAANRPIGTSRKRDVHHAATPLHRGFSVFLFDVEGRTLLQQRSLRKPTWPGVWSNACCGHPQLQESTLQAVQRRLGEELGLEGVALEIVLPDYRYRFTREGIVENEFCPVAVGMTSDEPRPNPNEVHDVRWLDWGAFLEQTRRDNAYSEWCVEEAALLADHPAFQRFYNALRPGPT